MLQIRVFTVMGQPTVSTSWVLDTAGGTALKPEPRHEVQPCGYWADDVAAEDYGTAALVDLLDRALNACGSELGARGGWPDLI